MLWEICNNTLVITEKQPFIFLWNQIWDFIEKISSFLDQIKCLLICNNRRIFINFAVEFRVLDSKISLFNKPWDFLKLIKGIVWVMKHNSIEDFG